ncbi:MAG: response regulator [bacterium]
MGEKNIILVVDDDNHYRKRIVKWLKPNYEVFEAGTGIELLKRIMLLKPDVIILDVGLPWRIGGMAEIIGGDLLEIVLEFEPNIQIIMISGTVDDGKFIRRAFNKGAVSYFLKDEVNSQELIDEIKKALLKRQKILPEKSLSLIEIIKRILELDNIIRKEFTKTYTFLDIDLVKSTKMLREEKNHERKDINIIYSLNEYHEYVKETVLKHKGEILNSVGDEGMCYFEDPNEAIDAGISILEGRGRFNKERNRLKEEFNFRIGIHTGKVILSSEEKKAFGEVLHITGHLQKNADTNGILISKSTRDIIKRKDKFSDATELPEDKIIAFSYKP